MISSGSQILRRISVVLHHIKSVSSSPAAASLNYHSKRQLFIQRNMKIKLLPALDDNYMYLLVDEATNKAAIVDPVEPKKVLEAVREEAVELTTVLTTHHHWDHAGGNEELAKLVPNLTVHGGDDRIGALNSKVKQDQQFNIGKLKVKCYETPCHTTGHICYYVTTDNTEEPPVVFTGDTLFQAGCGRFFEGTPQQMHEALIIKLSALPKNTKVFCGHEYSVNNLKFAEHVEPDNKAVQERLSWAQTRRSKGEPTVPSTIGEEMEINPFMRTSVDSVQKFTGESEPVAVMGKLRAAKDKFKIGGK